MFKMLDVITIGSATRDVFLKSEGVELRKHSDSPTGIEQCFPLGLKIPIKELVFTTGGGATNTAVTFARQGLKTGCVGVVGNDFNGKEVIKELKREKIKTFFTVHGGDPTAYSVVLVHQDAERTILSYRGEGQHLEVEKIPWRKMKAKWFFFDSLGGSKEVLEKAFEHTTTRNFKIAFNPGGKELEHGLEKLKPYLAEVDIFSVNKEEGEELLNSKFKIQNSNEIQNSKSKTAEEILKELDELVKGIVVLTLGPQGVLVSDKQKIYKAGTP
ncbi:MAG: ribokinase family sugar kinase, partial [Parcubacteria group bacterium Gr01-1014_2]